MSPRVEAEPLHGWAPLAPAPEVLTVIVTAVEASLVEPAAARSPAPGWRVHADHAWRFSARWWSGPAPLRRDRPTR
ncbi:MAG TPA: hypothetical protein VND23_06250 [Acidimicrobiales bacterium]|nr:hypothetical protein [Acidimicrobiales bacterium]